MTVVILVSRSFTLPFKSSTFYLLRSSCWKRWLRSLLSALAATSKTGIVRIALFANSSNSTSNIEKDKVDHAPVWSVGRVLVYLSVAVEPVGG